MTPAEHDPIIRPLLAKIDKALGAPLDKIFVAGGIVTEESQIDALGDLLLGVQGHGVSITDNYREQWEKGCEACRSQGDLPYDDMDGYRDLAAEKLDATGYPPVEEGEEVGPAHEPIIETAFSVARRARVGAVRLCFHPRSAIGRASCGGAGGNRQLFNRGTRRSDEGATVGSGG